MKFPYRAVSIAALMMISAGAWAQADSPEAQRATERARVESERAEDEAARARLEAARRELEAAAREVARASADRVGPIVRRVFVEPGMNPRRPVLGLNIVDVERGVRVVGVTPNGPGAKAGVQVDDLITAIDGRALVVADGEAPLRRLFDRLDEVTPGDAVELTVTRDGSSRTVEVVTSDEPDFVWFGDLDAAAALPATPPMPPGAPGFGVAGPGGRRMMFFNSAFAGGVWGQLQLVEMSPALGEYFGTAEGLLVLRAPEDDALQLVDGDVILGIGGRVPTSVEHAMRILASFEPGEKLSIDIMRQKRRRTVTIDVPARAAGVEDEVVIGEGLRVIR
jgi:S1-C subfamily serine protease